MNQALASGLSMLTTAEGVETGAQADFLQEVGCDQLQGFYLGRPMPLDRLPGIILNDFRDVLAGERRIEGLVRCQNVALVGAHGGSLAVDQ